MRFAILAVSAALTVLWALAADAQAAVVGAGATGFQVQHGARIAAPPDKVWAAIVRPSGWWNPEHTWSKDAGNLSINPVAGGCYCEKWPGGSVAHMTVIYAVPNRTLRMSGGLGPLQSMGVTGAMTWTLAGTADGSTNVTLDYAVGGYSPNGFETWSKAVDGMLAEQFNRFQLYMQTGHPDARATQ
jgi:uncharacterized protein YndB with AHSA1/START domain